jgi:hypothetical protein
MKKENKIVAGVAFVVLATFLIIILATNTAYGATSKVQKVTVSVKYTCDNGVSATYQAKAKTYKAAKEVAAKRAKKAAEDKTVKTVKKRGYAWKSIYKPGEQYEKANRRWVESRGSYKTNTGNGYLGAYQFSKFYVQGWCKKARVVWLGEQDFLQSQQKQDKLADWYAKSRYGGWKNVPWIGGW